MRRRLLILGLVCLGAYLATGLYQVRPGEQAVVRRFGRVLEEPRLPGLNFGLPWGLDQVNCIAVDEQRHISVGFQDGERPALETAPPGQVLTGDNHLIDLRLTVYYRVHPEGIVQYLLNGARIEDFLARAAEVALASTVAAQRVDAILLGRAANLEAAIRERLDRTLAGYQLGVVIDSVNLTYVQPPPELVEVFREVNRARTQKEIAEREAVGERLAAVSTARNQALKERTDAESTFHQRLTQAQAEAHNFLALWQHFRGQTTDSGNALLNLYLTEMQAVLARMQVRTVTNANVEQTIFMPLPDK